MNGSTRVLSLALTTVIASLCFGREEKATPSFRVRPIPAWVKQINAPENPTAEPDDTGVAYLLIDQQDNLERSAFYYHQVRKIISRDESRKTYTIRLFGYNPAYETLTINRLQLVRDGVSQNRLDPSRIRFFPIQHDTARARYDRRYGVEIELADVHVGDTIEIAHTVDGENPLKRGRLSVVYPLQYHETPVGRMNVRVLYPASHQIAFQLPTNAKPPIVSTAAGKTELIYQDDNVPAQRNEDDVPPEYSYGQHLQISDFRDWRELAKWAMALFQVKPAHSQEFIVEREKLRAITDPEQRVVAALQFVEDEIGFVNVSTWIGQNPLSSPDEVLHRKEADDKEKALLLVTLLRDVGIDAAPALVADNYRRFVPKQLPSTDVFDHAIVQVRIGESVYWIDPMREAQRGPLSQIFVAPYEYALVLRPETTDLTKFSAPKDAQPAKKFTYNYRVLPPEKDSELQVVSEYRGLSADDTRKYFRNNNRDEIQKRYLEYYTRTYPAIKMQKALWYEEEPGQDACRVTEFYTIPNIWQLSDEKDRYTLTFHPRDIYSAVGDTVSTQRSNPLRLKYPNSVVQEISIEMFEDWPLDAKGSTIKTDFFEVHDEPNATGSHIQLNYRFKTLKDHVEVNELGKYNEDVNKASDSLGYSLTYRTPEQLKQQKSLPVFNWAVAAAAFAFLVSAGSLAWVYFRYSKLPNPIPPPVDTPAHLNGIGGWLILLAIGQIIRPISYIKAAYDLYPTMMDTNSWNSLTDPTSSSYHPWWAPALLFELFFDIVALVFCFLLIALFFKKRAVWPRCFIAFIVFGVVGSALDLFLIHQIPEATQSSATIIGGLFGVAIAAAIWIPYAYRSKRVKATFRY